MSPATAAALQVALERFGTLTPAVTESAVGVLVRRLERDGLIERHVYDERPLRVEYALSPLARTLLPLVIALKTWAEDSLKVIEANNRAFDRKFAA